MTKRPYDNWLYDQQVQEALATPVRKRTDWQQLIVASELRRRDRERDRKYIQWFFNAHRLRPVDPQAH